MSNNANENSQSVKKSQFAKSKDESKSYFTDFSKLFGEKKSPNYLSIAREKSSRNIISKKPLTQSEYLDDKKKIDEVFSKEKDLTLSININQNCKISNIDFFL